MLQVLPASGGVLDVSAFPEYTVKCCLGSFMSGQPRLRPVLRGCDPCSEAFSSQRCPFVLCCRARCRALVTRPPMQVSFGTLVRFAQGCLASWSSAEEACQQPS